MEQYLQLLRTIKEKGVYKPAARLGMPGTQSLFGYQLRHNLTTGFPLLTTKKIYWRGVVTELLWFLKGDTNIKYLVDNGVNIWSEDSYNYYVKIASKNTDDSWRDIYRRNADGSLSMFNFEEFTQIIKEYDVQSLEAYHSANGYTLGDTGYQYGKLWRKWDNYKIIEDLNHVYGGDNITNKPIDQIKELIEGLKNNSESRRHIITAWNPATLDDMALNACHCLVQFNCRPATESERSYYAINNALMHRNEIMFDIIENPNRSLSEQLNENNIPKYYLDCQLYQRSADVVLGVPFNIASYALLTHILAKICNMIPGEFIHTFGDVHIYDNHKEAVEEQLTRTPGKLPTLKFKNFINWNDDLDDILNNLEVQDFLDEFNLENYNPQAKIQAKLSTGLK